MTPKQYINEEQEKYLTAKEWADVRGKEHFKALKDGDIEELDEHYLTSLAMCETWDQAFDIAVRYII